MPGLSELRTRFEAIRDERRTHANTAEKVGNAFLSILPYLGNYVSKDQPETLQYLLTLLAGVVIGDTGEITLNPDGSITCHHIHVDGSAIFDELVFNRQRVNEGDQLYTDRGVIDHIEILGNGMLRITLRKEYEQQVHSFRLHDCLKARMNNLDTEGTFFTSWLRVTDVDLTNNTIDCLPYPDNEVPGGHNYLPLESATIARWGNAVDTSRQQLFYLSATDGNFCFLQGVTKPIINDQGTNTAAFIGLPANIPALNRLVQEGTISRNKTVLYAQTIITESVITMKHDGTPDYTQREWDSWDRERQYIKGFDDTEQRYVQDNVWHGSSLWRCVVPQARIGEEPSLTNTDWACIRSGGLVLEIESTEGDFFDGEKSFQTTLVAMVRHGELTISPDDISGITWTRESDDEDGDVAWNTQQASHQQSLNLRVSYNLEDPSLSDIPVPFEKCGFRCTLTVLDTPLSFSYNIE